ncbi:hypothetical protein SAMN04487917_105249 [Arthrobacter sp. yr096]|nr:hypothetical protein SAMN04487917_105249 [Arthrobacter sp. yr096]
MGWIASSREACVAAGKLAATWQASRDLGGARQEPRMRTYLIISPAGLTKYQTPPTPWPVTSPGALSLA